MKTVNTEPQCFAQFWCRVRTGNKTPVVCWPQDTLEALLGVDSVVYCVQGEKEGNLEQFLFFPLGYGQKQ